MRLEAVGKRYGLRQPWVVRGVTEEVPAGRLIRVEGRNGSGKSTLLRMAAGALMPSAGRVTGRPRAGYVPERFPGGLAFSAREYLEHMSRIHGLSGPAGSAAVGEWLERLGATEYAGSPLRTLSKGMCQKVAIAQALLSRPDLLVLDEAWTGLDQAARGAVDAAVLERVAAGGTVLFVDHDPARLAGHVSDRWRLESALLMVLAGDAAGDPRGDAGGGGAGDGGAGIAEGGVGPDLGATVVTLSGVEPGSLRQLRRAPGVLAVSADESAEPDHGLVRLTVTGRDSDALLRQVLAWDGVHVTGVQATGVQAAGADAAGVHVTGVQAAGVDVAGADVAGADVAGTDVAGMQAPDATEPGSGP